MCDQYLKEFICNRCSGSGEGMHDGTTCSECGGSGAIMVSFDNCSEDGEERYDVP